MDGKGGSHKSTPAPLPDQGGNKQMKYLKIIGLAAIAALALTALVGAGTASAGTVACTVNGTSCTSANEYTGAITSNLKTGTTAVLTNSLDQVTCTASSMNGEITEPTNASGNSTGSITSVTFSGCKDQFGSTCTVEALNVPWHAETTATEVAGKPNGNGKLTVSKLEKGFPEAKVVCGEALNCAFGVESASVDVIGSSTSPLIKTTGLVMTRLSGFCPSTATWDAEYTITKPTSLFLI
jgi:hypothetical protein